MSHINELSLALQNEMTFPVFLKKFTKEIKVTGYDELKTSSKENGVFVSERNEVFITDKGTIHAVTKRVNDKKSNNKTIVIGDKQIEYTCYIKCTKKEFDQLWPY